jgi:hypothetical protein
MEVVANYKAEQQQIQAAGQVPSVLYSNPQFVFLLDQYEKQLQMALDQKKNGTEFGIYGTEAASVGNVSTQGLESA